MNRRAAAAAVVAAGSALCFAPAGVARAEDAVVIWANYYKERSTRVIEPTIAITKDLPADVQVEVGYLVDQITSASGAFTVEDEPFSELRHDVRAGVRKRFLGFVRPGIRVRYSHEPDYDSLGFGADIELAFDRDNTVVRAYFQQQLDDVRSRQLSQTSGTTAIVDVGELDTTFLGASLTQVLTKELVVGGAIELQVLDGFQENSYRVETHPTHRRRHSASVWGAYHEPTIDLTARLGYRLYGDDWDLFAHTVDAEVTKRWVPAFETFVRFRFHTQDDVYFTTPARDPDARATDPDAIIFATSDPKLFAFQSRTYELGLRWTMSALAGTTLEPFARSRIEPSYAYLDQDNRYGAAHLVQLGWFWPF